MTASAPRRTDPASRAAVWRTVLEDRRRRAGWRRVERIAVVPETGSTQDEAARRFPGCPGALVTTLRQTAGRGRLGRRWIDERGESIALTITLDPADADLARLPLALGVALAEAIESLRPGTSAGLRWPNDVMLLARKCAGILVETGDGLARVGIGVNVNQRVDDWPEALAGRAISLREARRLGHGPAAPLGSGAPLPRRLVVARVVEAVDSALAAPADDLVAAWRDRDVLRGTTCTFDSGRRLTGVVEDIDPASHLLVRDASGAKHRLPAATTSLVHDDAT